MNDRHLDWMLEWALGGSIGHGFEEPDAGVGGPRLLPCPGNCGATVRAPEHPPAELLASFWERGVRVVHMAIQHDVAVLPAAPDFICPASAWTWRLVLPTLAVPAW